MKKVNVIVLLLLVFLFTGCVKPIEEIKDVRKDNTSNQIITKEKIVTPTINIDEIIENGNDDEEEKIIETLETAETTEKRTIEEILESNKAKLESVQERKEEIERESEPLSVDQTEDDRVYHGDNEIDTTNWTYGKTPCEWIYVEPGIQIVSNYKPNGSKTFSVKSKVSSGKLGCYIPVFTGTDMMSNEYEGRFYCFDDYQKYSPEDMMFSNSLHDFVLHEMRVEDILCKTYGFEKTKNGLLKHDNGYVNIVYVTELNKLFEEHGDGLLDAKE